MSPIGTENSLKIHALLFYLPKNPNTYMLFAGREVRIGKNCARGLEYGPRPDSRPSRDRGAGGAGEASAPLIMLEQIL